MAGSHLLLIDSVLVSLLLFIFKREIANSLKRMLLPILYNILILIFIRIRRSDLL